MVDDSIVFEAEFYFIDGESFVGDVDRLCNITAIFNSNNYTIDLQQPIKFIRKGDEEPQVSLDASFLTDTEDIFKTG